MTGKCFLCNSKDLSFLVRKDGCDFYKCKVCGLVFMDRQFGSERPSDFLSKLGHHSKINRDLKIKKPRKYYVRILDKITEIGATGNLLDVGCANGELLFLAKKRGFSIKGVEPNKDTAEIAVDNGLDVFKGTLQEASFPDSFFSVICLTGVLGFCENPLSLLIECRRILKEDGLIVIGDSNADSFWMKATEKINKWFGFPWSVILPNYRLFIFSESNLKNLLSKLNFKVKKTEYDTFPLKHELSTTGLFQKFKKGKTIKDMLYLVTVFSAYTLIYLVGFLIDPIFGKSFRMTFFATKNN